MMENLYKDVFRDKKVFPIEVNIDELKTFSLGIDLSVMARGFYANPHREDTHDFFISMIDYIKINHLEDNPHALAVLYGHIAHYFFDIIAHPFIYHLDLSTKSVNILISNHHLIEGYLDSYLTRKILKKDIMDINESYFSLTNLNNEIIKNIIDYAYDKVYRYKRMHLGYQDTLNALITLERICKESFLTKNDLINLSGYRNYMMVNKLSSNDLHNEESSDYINPFNGDTYHDSFLTMFYQAVYMTENAICEVNRYLHNSCSKTVIDKVFRDISYDTGLPCSQGFNPKYLKKTKC